MSWPKASLALQPTRGFNADVADQELSLDFWSSVRNVQFRDGFATRIGGERGIYSAEVEQIAPEEFAHAVNAQLAGANWWLLFQANGQAHAVQSGTVARIDDSALSAVDNPYEISSALINGIPIVNNGKDEPKFWNGSGVLQALPGWTATETAKFIAVFKFHVFALNISGPGGSFPNLIKVSAATEPGTVPPSWTPAPDNDASSVELADSEGELQCAYRLQDSLLIYKRSSIYQARYVAGGNEPFAYRKVESAIGALTPRSVCDIGGAHFIVTDGDIMLFDGTTRRTIGEARVRDFLFDQLDPTNFLNLFCVYNRARDEVLVGFPQVGSRLADQALIYDVSRDCFGLRSFDGVTHAAVGFVNDAAPGNTWAERTEPWAQAQGTWAQREGASAKDTLQTLTATVFTQEDQPTPTPRLAQVVRSGLSFGDSTRYKFARTVHVRTRAPFGSLRVRVGGQDEPSGAIRWSEPVTLTGTEQIATVEAMGRYLAVELTSDDASVWKLTGVDIEAEMRGYY